MRSSILPNIDKIYHICLFFFSRIIHYLRWEIHNDGKEVAQFENSRASMAIGRRTMGALRFSGYIYIFDEDDDDVVGVVFNYQNNKNFYLLTATRTDSNQVKPGSKGEKSTK